MIQVAMIEAGKERLTVEEMIEVPVQKNTKQKQSRNNAISECKASLKIKERETKKS